MRIEALLKSFHDYLELEASDTSSPRKIRREAMQRRRALQQQLAEMRAKLLSEIELERNRPGGEGAFRRILVAIDGSVQAQSAIKLAGRLAVQIEAQIILLHVVGNPILLGPGRAIVEPMLRDTAIHAGAALLSNAKDAIPESVMIETALREGDPARDIVEAAETLGADLIVMGSNSRGRIERALLGSVASAVVRHAHCPVLTIGHPEMPEGDEKRSKSSQTPVTSAAEAACLI
jgi:nucleotide-binding universal stress UspA family protein